MSSESFKIGLSDGFQYSDAQKLSQLDSLSIDAMQNYQNLKTSLQKLNAQQENLSYSKASIEKEALPKWVAKRTELLQELDKSKPRINGIDQTVEELEAYKQARVAHTEKLRAVETTLRTEYGYSKEAASVSETIASQQHHQISRDLEKVTREISSTQQAMRKTAEKIEGYEKYAEHLKSQQTLKAGTAGAAKASEAVSALSKSERIMQIAEGSVAALGKIARHPAVGVVSGAASKLAAPLMVADVGLAVKEEYDRHELKKDNERVAEKLENAANSVKIVGSTGRAEVIGEEVTKDQVMDVLQKDPKYKTYITEMAKHPELRSEMKDELTAKVRNPGPKMSDEQLKDGVERIDSLKADKKLAAAQSEQRIQANEIAVNQAAAQPPTTNFEDDMKKIQSVAPTIDSSIIFNENTAAVASSRSSQTSGNETSTTATENRVNMPVTNADIQRALYESRGSQSANLRKAASMTL